MPQPNMIIYLNASLDTLLQRIEMRGREIEKNIDPFYLHELSVAYEQTMESFEKANPHIPILHFNGDKLDFVQRQSDLLYIFEQIENRLEGVNCHELT